MPWSESGDSGTGLLGWADGSEECDGEPIAYSADARPPELVPAAIRTRQALKAATAIARSAIRIFFAGTGEPQATKTCPECKASDLPIDATRCKYCRTRLTAIA